MTPEAARLLQQIREMYRQLAIDFPRQAYKQTPAFRARLAEIRIVVEQFLEATKET